jgi:hypothetical protein
MPRRTAKIPALPDGAPSKVASRASEGWLAAFRGVHNANMALPSCSPARRDRCQSGSSGSRRALRLAAVADGEAVERTKLQRIDGA